MLPNKPCFSRPSEPQIDQFVINFYAPNSQLRVLVIIFSLNPTHLQHLLLDKASNRPWPNMDVVPFRLKHRLSRRWSTDDRYNTTNKTLTKAVANTNTITTPTLPNLFTK